MGFHFHWILALLVAAVQTRPATRGDPSRETAGQTPRETLRALNRAMRTGDAPAIRDLLASDGPSERRMVDADAEMAAALARLRTAAVQVFGDQAAIITGDSATAADSAARIDAAAIVINGDVATVTYRDQRDSPFVLRRIDGRWRIPVSELGDPMSRAALDQRLADLAVQRRVVLEMAEQISGRKFATAEEARDAWRSRILEAATSQPATQPSTAP